MFVVTLIVRLIQRRHLADASIDRLNTAYPNTGFVGLPLCLLAFGKESLAPAVIATIITVCGLFACAIVRIELGLQTEKNFAAPLGRVSLSLMKNPLLIAPIAGALVNGSGAHVLDGAEALLKLLGKSVRVGRARTVPRRERRDAERAHDERARHAQASLSRC